MSKNKMFKEKEISKDIKDKKEKKESSNIIENILKSFDIYPTKFNLYMKGKPHVKTFYGGMISLIFIVIFLIFAFFFLSTNIEKNEQRISELYLVSEEPKKFSMKTIDSDLINPYFVFLMSIKDNNGNFLEYDYHFKKYFHIEFLEITREKNKSIPDKRFDVIKCKEDILDKKLILDKNFDINKYFCPEKKEFNLEGDFFSPVFKYFTIRVSKCNDTKNPGITCETDPELIENKVINTVIEVSYSKPTINQNMKNQIPLEFYLITRSYAMDMRLYYQENYFISLNEIYSNENLLFEQIGVLSSKYADVFTIEENNKTLESTYLTIFIRSSNNYLKTVRYYKRIIDTVALLGGLWKFFIIIGVLLVQKVNFMTKIYKIGNKLFNIISSGAEKKMNETETYEAYKKNFSEDKNSVLYTNGKSELEAKLYIDLYKYDKYSRVYFNIRSYLMKIFDYCKRKDLNTNNFDEKISNVVTNKLDIVKIMKFIKEFKIFKSIILNKKNIFLSVAKRKDLSYNFINLKLRKNFLRNINYNIEYKRLKSERKFFSGLRYFKNKPLMDPLMDIALLKRYKWDKQMFEEYMLRKFEFLNKKEKEKEKKKEKENENENGLVKNK